MKKLLSALLPFVVATSSAAQVEAPSVTPAPDQDYCITVMSGFPGENPEARYQFFRLAQELGQDATPDFARAIVAYRDGAVSPDTPLLDVIDTIANPVIRQAAPEITVANMGHLVEFATRCEALLGGQVDSLLAFDPDLAYGDPVIVEDVVFLRQILSESLRVLDTDGTFTTVLDSYDRALVIRRDEAEFEEFDLAVADLENLYMADLDGRLARSNDLINGEMDRSTLPESVGMAEDMNEELRKRARQDGMWTIIRILTAY